MSGPRIAMVAAEHSGDMLGAGLIKALKERYPQATFEGVGGGAMEAEGLRSRIPMERLGVMGLVEVLVHLPELLRERKTLVDAWTRDPPDVFIGVDAPDFNLGLARRLRRAGIATVQYVSPTFWAWRQGRIGTLRESVDLVLCIFPFEADTLNQHGVKALYAGHPTAEELPLDPDRSAARGSLRLPQDGELIALLPGSRRREIESLAGPFLQAALWLHERRPNVRFVVPLVSNPIARLFEEKRKEYAPDLELDTVIGRSREVLAAADVVLTASGTATLETLLTKRPMVVGYRLHGLTWFLARSFRLVKSPWAAMANILAGEELAPEFLQHNCTAEKLGAALLEWLDDPVRAKTVAARYRQIHQEFKLGSSASAAAAVADLISDIKR